MSASKTIQIQVERLIPAAPEVVFDAWVDPRIPGNPWHLAEKFVLDPKVDGLFFWTYQGTSHYGRFTEFQRAARMRHTWVSPSTHGLESVVTVTFQKDQGGTRMTLVHSDLPDDEDGRGHEDGWNFFFGTFVGQF